MFISARRAVTANPFGLLWKAAVWLAMTPFLASCGGSPGSSGLVDNTPSAAQCVPSDPSTSGECGSLLIGLSDADGDFLSYSVDVLGLTLERADGAVVNVLPATTRIDFAQYVDLTEFVSVATVPPGRYVAGRITLDYSDAEIVVEDGGAARDAIVVDADGNPLAQTELTIRLADRHPLLIGRGLTSFLSLDFDLDASHVVDLSTTPATATAKPFIVAELDPVDVKDFRVRGPLLEANVEQMFYAVELRPFHDRVRDFGRFRVGVTDATDFEVNGEAFTGADGLRALDAAGAGILTVARGTFDTGTHRFTADYVLAGSSVPGNGLDAVSGNVLSRDGDQFVVRGGAVILSDTDRAFFRDDVTVTVGADTLVYRAFRTDRPLGMPFQRLDTSAISIGQAVTVRGEVTLDDETGLHIDATQGAVAMHLTHLTGIVNSVTTGQVDVELHTIDRRRAALFDFTGTGTGPETDADPADYEIATGTLLLPSDAAGRPVAVYGFPNEFGAAPPDFAGRTVVDYADVLGAVGVGWGENGTTAPFLMMDATGLLLDNANPDIGSRHFIKNGPVLIDLTALDSNTLIAPRESGRMLFGIRTGDSVQLYADFDEFVGALGETLNGANAARSMYARGRYDPDTNVFTAYKVLVDIVAP